MSSDSQSESKSWWQTLPGLLTAGAAIITAITGLLVAVNQAGLFRHSRQHPVQVQSKTEGSAGSSDAGVGASAVAGVSGAGPSSRQLMVPGNAEARTGQVVFKLLSARVDAYSPDEVSLRFMIRMTNNDRFDANFWAASFRLSVGGSLQAPANDLDELVSAHSSKEGEVEFVIPANTAAAGLQMGEVGEGKATIPIHLQDSQP